MNVYAIPGIIRTIGELRLEIRFSKDQIIKKVESAVCSVWGIHPSRLHETTRERIVVEPRQLIFWWMLRYGKQSSSNIGDYYGKDHATVLHARKVVDNLLDTNKEYRLKYEECMQLLETLTKQSKDHE